MFLRISNKRFFLFIFALLLAVYSPYVNIIDCNADTNSRSHSSLGVWDISDLDNRIIPVRNDLSGYSTNVSNSMARWNSVRSTSNGILLTFSLSPNTNQNNIEFDPYMDVSVVAHCDLRKRTDNTIISFTISLNSKLSWSNGAAYGKYDIESVLTHELGHALGIRHCHELSGPVCNTSQCPYNVMYPSIGTNSSRRTLTSYDITAFRSLYS